MSFLDNCAADYMHSKLRNGKVQVKLEWFENVALFLIVKNLDK